MTQGISVRMASGQRFLALPNSTVAPRAKARQAVIAMCTALATLCVPALMVTPGWQSLALAAAASAGIAGLLYFCSVAILPGLLAPRFVVAVYGIQLAALVPISLFRAVLDEYRLLALAMIENQFRLTSALLLIPISVVVSALMIRLLAQGPALRGGLAQALRQPPDQLYGYVAVCLILQLLRWFAIPSVTGQAGYFVRIVAGSVELVPVVAGWFSWRSPRLHRMCLLFLLANALIGAFMGTRQGLVVLAGYSISRIIAATRRVQIKSVVLLAPAFAAGFYVFGLIGTIRGDLGRDSLDLLTPEGISRSLDFAKTASQSLDSGDGSLGYSAWGRLFAWSNAAVVIQTPEVIGFRGFSGLRDELAGYARLNGDSVEAREAFLDAGLGTARARDYGFTVNAATTIEFSVMADGWARAGSWGVLLFGGILVLILAAAEYFTQHCAAFDENGRLLIACVCIKVAVFAAASPLLYCVRTLIITGGLVFAGSALAVYLTKRKTKPKTRRAW